MDLACVRQVRAIDNAVDWRGLRDAARAHVPRMARRGDPTKAAARLAVRGGDYRNCGRGHHPDDRSV